MRRITLLVGTVTLLSAGAIGAVACGGDDDATVPAPDSGTTPGTSSSTSSGATSGDPGTSSSGGNPTDGGTSSSSGSTDLPSNPGQYACGAATCDAGGGGANPNVCCQAANATDSKCSKANDCDNEGTTGKLQLICDETADCPTLGPGAGIQQKCCYAKGQAFQPGTGPVPSFSTICRTQCRTGGGQQAKVIPQLCKTSAECGDAGACAEKTCDGFKLHVCGSPEGCQ